MKTILTRKRVTAYALVLLFYAVIIVATVNWSTRGQLLLSVEYHLLSELAHRYQVADLKVIIDNPPIRMFLIPDDKILTLHIMQSGYWERKETELFFNNVVIGDTVIDVGASIGYYTLIAARLVGQTGRVYAFEPEPVSFDLLDRNVRLNGNAQAVIEPLALSDRKGRLTLHFSDSVESGGAIYNAAQHRPYLEVPMDTLDNYFKGKETRIDFVKIDAEGAEPAILKGMTRLLESNPGIRMMIEFSPRAYRRLDSSGEECLASLEARDFLVFDIRTMKGRGAGLRPAEPAELLGIYTVENGLSTNLFAVRGLAKYRQLQGDLARQCESPGADAGPGSAGSPSGCRAAEEALDDFLTAVTKKR